MKILHTIILALVQGLTEFLPVSSSGHLLLLEKLGIGEEDIFFNVMLHVGTLFAVFVALRKEWTKPARQNEPRPRSSVSKVYFYTNSGFLQEWVSIFLLKNPKQGSRISKSIV